MTLVTDFSQGRALGKPSKANITQRRGSLILSILLKNNIDEENTTCKQNPHKLTNKS